MRKVVKQITRTSSVAALLAVLGACATQSGLTYDIRAVNAPDQKVPLYRVTCNGMLSSTNACARAAEDFCKGQGFTPVQHIDRVESSQPMRDPREITFMCGKPQQTKPVASLAAQPQLQPQPKERAAVPSRQILLQGDATFALDSAALSPTARQSLDQFLLANRGVAFRRIAVTGYTDSTGSAAYNLRLSEARARSVVTYLRTGGLQTQQFVAEGRGSADPIASNATAEGRAQNRRVEARVVVD